MPFFSIVCNRMWEAKTSVDSKYTTYDDQEVFALRTSPKILCICGQNGLSV